METVSPCFVAAWYTCAVWVIGIVGNRRHRCYLIRKCETSHDDIALL